ncbi:MAG: UDP-N-acetylmuramate dehydrogenase [Gammaproteobacteria bacterium]|nr:UDP-N-acetylmuramate dehydrogenase [Gammaproteobacteria bacterium]MBT7603058.1 UDP-N-acetylmuramate dehydrogenase [Gammaproteobacteria bacterium]
MNIKSIKKILKGRIRENVCMKEYNTWKIGGSAQYFFEPSNLDDLKKFLENSSNIDIIFLGNGSNVLIRDGGINGCVVSLKNTLNNYTSNKKGKYIFEAGFSCMKIAQITAKDNYGGLEFLCGIPGSLGGALAMNAGCYGGNIWDYVNKVIMINKNGNLVTKNKREFKYGYRNLELEDNNFFIGATFNLQENQLKNSLDIIKEYLKDRRSKQPTGLPSCGSVFKNPENYHAANLIESSGLKNYKIGKAYISDKHANFIITEPSASSSDVEDLIEFIQKTVFENKNIFLETEVKFIGIKK